MTMLSHKSHAARYTVLTWHPSSLATPYLLPHHFVIVLDSPTAVSASRVWNAINASPPRESSFIPIPTNAAAASWSSPMQAPIAEFVASSHSNKQVAAQRYLMTVAAHLHDLSRARPEPELTAN